ncbi:hypothetical protein [Aurantiacibacter luteus]|nr:hypothetical protein [Aurantiacibacter luteus]
MRYAPFAAALSLFVAVSASVGSAQDYRAVALVGEGRAQLAGGETQAAIDSFEAALAIDPAYTDVYIDLANAARAEGLQGKAIHFYREVLERDPQNVAAIAGEGEALAERGALTAARENLATLTSLCGATCTETMALAAAIDRGPMLATSGTDDGVTQN